MASLKRLSEEIVETTGTESGFTMFPMSMGLKGRFVCNPALKFLNCAWKKMVELRQQISGRETVQEVELVQGRGHPGQKSWILRLRGIETVDEAGQLIGFNLCL
ncbi:16S rRNA processing protein RimM family [Prunus dulcis]|uniref:16S rRNA processing protein RimM family n=1 Tax=Prunus dulcis TaxID=3755 RepID=A0A4Y1R1F8_PRUDU|nr:16S rRNA processing protein RimM family [Prunus dulcis]